MCVRGGRGERCSRSGGATCIGSGVPMHACMQQGGGGLQYHIMPVLLPAPPRASWQTARAAAGPDKEPNACPAAVRCMAAWLPLHAWAAGCMRCGAMRTRSRRPALLHALMSALYVVVLGEWPACMQLQLQLFCIAQPGACMPHVSQAGGWEKVSSNSLLATSEVKSVHGWRTQAIRPAATCPMAAPAASVRTPAAPPANGCCYCTQSCTCCTCA